MELALSAYSTEHIVRYFDDVKRDGLTEHGFPRLTSNIGILIAEGRRLDLVPLFLQMMDFCCKDIPRGKAANDFSVREIINCIRAVEKSSAVDSARIAEWKSHIASIDPFICYDVYAKDPADPVKNWALFTGVSEYFRQSEGLGGDTEFIDIQLESQLKWLDENGMYMDAKGDVHQPMVYDLVPRGLFAMILNEGYRGKHYAAIDECLRKSALLTLKMQSPSGELAFGGRSNQFIHNEAWLCVIYEYEAKRYAREGNLSMAKKFKAARKRALEAAEYWLNKKPLYHIKNRFPTETKFGCEQYAYFDKYMITAASFFHAAYLIADDSIETSDERDTDPCAFATSYHFHKLFLKSGGYGAEIELNGDSHYDASGLGRVHREGAPSAICMSTPCPSHPNFAVDIEDPTALSICPGVFRDGKWSFALDEDAKYETVSYGTDEASALATLKTALSCGETLTSGYKVSSDGVEVRVEGCGEVALMLPAFLFDGEKYSEIKCGGSTLSIFYEGYECRYTVDGEILGGDRISAGRNGHYKAYYAKAKECLNVKIEIFKA